MGSCSSLDGYTNDRFANIFSQCNKLAKVCPLFVSHMNLSKGDVRVSLYCGKAFDPIANAPLNTY